MKKILFATTVISSLLLSATAYAADPDYTSDYASSTDTFSSSTMNSSGYSTVLITKVDSTEDTDFTDDEIVYINQDDSTFAASTTFLLREDPAAGTYRVSLGGSENSALNIGYFTVGDFDITANDKVMDGKTYGGAQKQGNSEADLYKKAFRLTLGLESLNEYKSMKLVENGKVVGIWSLDTPSNDTTTTGGGDVLVGIQIYNITSKTSADGLSLYLSTDEIPTSTTN